MLLLAVLVTVVAIAAFGAIVQWWGKRDFGAARSEASTAHLPGMHTDGRPSQAVVDSGELGVGPFGIGQR